MGFLDFLNKDRDFLDIYIEEKSKELMMKELMIEHAIDLIAKTIAKSEIQVFRNKDSDVKKTIDEVYYLLNIRPNDNEEGTTFIYNLVAQLLRENRALIIRLDDKLYLANSFKRSNSILTGKTYSEIEIIDDDLNRMILKKSFSADDAVYLTLGNNKIQKVLDDFYKEYAEMIKASLNGFKKGNYKKYKLSLPTKQTALRDPDTEKDISMDAYIKKITGKLLDDQDSVTALSGAFDLEELSKKSGIDSKDTREIINDFGNKVAMAFNIPLDVYWGNKTEKSVGTNDFITFAVLPTLNIIEDGFNAKLIERESYIKGERIRFDKFTMKHFDIMDVATSLDKLFAIGWSHNNLNEIIGVPKINEDWANKHHVTKNYMDVNESDQFLKGGE